MRVLIVEDDEHIRDMLKHVVEVMGFSAYATENTEEAAKSLQSTKPDVILLDLLIQGTIATPFIETARQLMTDGHTPHIVILSAMQGAKNVAEANHVDFLAKPFDIDTLEAILKEQNKRPWVDHGEPQNTMPSP